MLIDRNGIYHYKFQIDGRLYRGSTKLRGTKKAEQFEKGLIGAIQSGEGIKVKEKAPFLYDHLDAFAVYVSNNRTAQKTKEYYQAGINYLKQQPIADIRIHMIRASDIETIQFPDHYSGSTINRALRTLRRALNLAVDHDLINKCPKITLVEEHERKQTIPHEMEQTIIGSIAPTGKLALTIMLDCGLRPSEIVALRIEHLDFGRGTIEVQKGKTRKSARFVPMSDRVRDAILAHLNGRKQGWLLPSNRIEGKPLQRQSLTQAFAAVRRAQNLPKCTTLYLARHTYATDIMTATGNVFVTKEIMGHSSTATLGRYQHPALAGMAAAINERNESNAKKVTKKSQSENAPDVMQVSGLK